MPTAPSCPTPPETTKCGIRVVLKPSVVESGKQSPLGSSRYSAVGYHKGNHLCADFRYWEKDSICPSVLVFTDMESKVLI